MQEEGELENLFNNSHEQAMEMRAQEDCKTGTNRSCKPVFFLSKQTVVKLGLQTGFPTGFGPV